MLQQAVILLIMTGVLMTCVNSELLAKMRPKRKTPLLFNGDVSAINFNYGFGVPLEDSSFETVVTGFVFKCSYNLPSSIKDLKPTALISRKLTSVEANKNSTIDDNKSSIATLLEVSHQSLSNYRWLLYRGLEILAANLGFSGRACVLRGICEAAEIPITAHDGIIGELAHILLTPSSTNDTLSKHSDYEYYHAEALGRQGAACERIFTECTKSIMQYFTKLSNHSNSSY